MDDNTRSTVLAALTAAADALRQGQPRQQVVDQLLAAVERPAASPQPRRLRQAAADLDGAMRDGSVQDLLGALLAYEQTETEGFGQQLEAQGMPRTAVARVVAETRAQAAQENATMVSNMLAMDHATKMSIIGNIK